MIDKLKANKYIESKLNEPFAWGTNDCNTFIVEYFDKVLGTDLLKIIYQKYSTKKRCNQISKRICSKNIRQMFGIRHERISSKQSYIGDILVKHNENWDSCHICIGSKMASSVDEQIGTAILPISDFNDFDSAYRFSNEN